MLELEIQKGVEVYSSKEAKGTENEYVQFLKKLAETQDKSASASFSNDLLKKFKYAASILGKKDNLYFTFRKDKDKKETHSRVWWNPVKPAKKPKKAKSEETSQQ